MPTTEEMLKLRIKEICEEIRHIQSQMNAFVVSSTEDTFKCDTETRKLQQEILLAMRRYQDALFSTLNSTHRKYADYKEQGQDVKLSEFEQLTKRLTKRKTEMEKTTKTEYVICRGYYCGVHAGYIKEREGNHVVLNEARRLWKWETVKGISLSEVAKYGIDASGSKVCTKCEEIWLGDVYEVIPCTDDARKSIEEAADADVV